ncbi:hypothetical protein HPP92_028915 [Vanilla planifolia]|uniref:Uncharacterized protein n=1 Tax=Vanilla planifolia TaxID=51239 RepID=A0A835P457_VANPL|nr:hypothetical protein HPP92_028915 [Vanilla planifolia]KAG0446286.1 hypothetical protein HPP92_028905 [Vanilla planifolia]
MLMALVHPSVGCSYCWVLQRMVCSAPHKPRLIMRSLFRTTGKILPLPSSEEAAPIQLMSRRLQVGRSPPSTNHKMKIVGMIRYSGTAVNRPVRYRDFKRILEDEKDGALRNEFSVGVRERRKTLMRLVADSCNARLRWKPKAAESLALRHALLIGDPS